MKEYKSLYESPMGLIVMRSDGIFLTGLWFDKAKYVNWEAINTLEENNDLDIFIRVKQWLDDYFEGKKIDTTSLKIKLEGTEFQKKVWDILLNIPYGKVITYGDIAKVIANGNETKAIGCQAIGQAVSHNPISIIVPCHRVIGKSGKLTGYAGGLDKKIKLLELEKNNKG